MALGYKVTVKPPHEREQMIKDQLATPLGELTTYDVFESTPTKLKIVRLPLNVPIYRMANGRTQTEQISYAATHELKSDHFLTNEENETTQQIQHEILRRFADEGSESITPIVEVLKRDRQREPIWITPRGIVVNGNRRLAAMRELYTDSPTDFPEFGHVECAVLPALTPDQIVEIEIRLQMTPETKLPYGWIDECLMIQRQISRGKTEAQVAHLIRQKQKDVKAAISALKEADIYLRDWREAPGDYHKVDKGKQFFYDLPGRLKGKSGDLLEASRRIGWVLFDNSDELGRRVYDFNAIFGDKAEDALARLSERTEIDLTEDDPGDADRGDDLDIDLGDDAAEGSKYGALIAAIDDPTRRDEIRDELIVVCQTMIDAGRTDRQGKSALFAVRDANTRLAEVDLTKAAPETYGGIEKQLDEISRRTEELKTKLKAYRVGEVSSAPDNSGKK